MPLNLKPQPAKIQALQQSLAKLKPYKTPLLIALFLMPLTFFGLLVSFADSVNELFLLTGFALLVCLPLISYSVVNRKLYQGGQKLRLIEAITYLNTKDKPIFVAELIELAGIRAEQTQGKAGVRFGGTNHRNTRWRSANEVAHDLLLQIIQAGLYTNLALRGEQLVELITGQGIEAQEVLEAESGSRETENISTKDNYSDANPIRVGAKPELLEVYVRTQDKRYRRALLMLALLAAVLIAHTVYALATSERPWMNRTPIVTGLLLGILFLLIHKIKEQSQWLQRTFDAIVRRNRNGQDLSISGIASQIADPRRRSKGQATKSELIIKAIQQLIELGCLEHLQLSESGFELVAGKRSYDAD